MDRFTASSSFSHRTPPLTAVLLVQLGTPDDPEPGPVRRYLKQFLSDPRVVEIPRLAWWPILNGIILNTRPRKSSAKYRAVWTPHGSPLQVHTRRQAVLLRGALGERGLDVAVVHAMRYGNPPSPRVLRELRDRNLTRLLVVPLYPQYAASTTASAFDAHRARALHLAQPAGTAHGAQLSSRAGLHRGAGSAGAPPLGKQWPRRRSW